MKTRSAQQAFDTTARPFGPGWEDYLAARSRYFAQLAGAEDTMPEPPDRGESQPEIVSTADAG